MRQLATELKAHGLEKIAPMELDQLIVPLNGSEGQRQKVILIDGKVDSSKADSVK